MTDIQSLLETVLTVSFTAPTLGVCIGFAIVALLLFCSGFVSASEIAFFSLGASDMNAIEEGDHKADEKVAALLDEKEHLLATILIWNNLVNVAIITILSYCITQTVSFGKAVWLEFLVMTVLLTFLLLLFGEVIPKIYSAQHTLGFCRFAAPWLTILGRLCSPLSRLLVRFKVITQRFVPSSQESLTVDDLEKAMELTDNKDIAQEKSMLQGIIRFGGEMAKEIMTSRMDIVDLDIKANFSDVLECILQNNYSRIPVYQGTQDNIKGVLCIKDLIPYLDKPATFRWQSLIRSPYFVPETKMIDDLLRDFQANKVHMAIVVDEFGGTSGLVTMEDILEEIVGEINDEYDDEEKPYQRLNQNTYLFEGKTLLSDLTKILSLEDDFFENTEGEAETLAGLLLEIKGDFPEQNERINIAACGRSLTCEVTEVDKRRIVRVKVIVHG